jgi:hypothetical protein
MIQNALKLVSVISKKIQTFHRILKVYLLMAKQCFQKILVPVFLCGKLQAELVGINGVY